MAVVTMKQLLESGVHFGHETKRWNPKMAPYIFTSRNRIHIIDLKITAFEIEKAYNALLEIVKNGGSVLFVGTKKQAQYAVRNEAKRTGQFYVDQRWLGGTLTNFKTIRKRIKYLHDLYKMEEDGTFEKLPKKEVLKLIHQREKLEKFLSGIKNMKKLPDAIYVVDPKKERNAILEARKLNIPVFGIVDTNCDPDDVDYIIPSNDDAIRAVNLVTHVMANAIIEAQGGYVEKVEDDEIIDLYDINDVKVKFDRKNDYHEKRDNNKYKNYDNHNKSASQNKNDEVKLVKEVEVEIEVKPEAKKEEVKPAETQSEIKAEEIQPKVKKAKASETKPVEEEIIVQPKVEETKPVEEEIIVQPKVEETKPETKPEKNELVEETTKNEIPEISYSKMTLAELKALAKSRGLKKYSTLKKAELIELLNDKKTAVDKKYIKEPTKEEIDYDSMTIASLKALAKEANKEEVVYEEMNLASLKALAKVRGLKRYSTLKKAELVELLKK